MPELAPFLLTVHILTAIAAFGPTVVLPVIAQMASSEPPHALFALRLIDRVERRIVIPLALTMPVSGGLLVWSEQIDLASAHWLVAATAVYAAAIAVAVGVQLRTVSRMIGIAEAMGSGGPEPAGRRAAELRSLGARARGAGVALTLMVVVIVSLMAGKPAI